MAKQERRGRPAGPARNVSRREGHTSLTVWVPDETIAWLDAEGEARLLGRGFLVKLALELLKDHLAERPVP